MSPSYSIVNKWKSSASLPYVRSACMEGKNGEGTVFGKIL